MSSASCWNHMFNTARDKVIPNQSGLNSLNQGVVCRTQALEASQGLAPDPSVWLPYEDKWCIFATHPLSIHSHTSYDWGVTDHSQVAGYYFQVVLSSTWCLSIVILLPCSPLPNDYYWPWAMLPAPSIEVSKPRFSHRFHGERRDQSAAWHIPSTVPSRRPLPWSPGVAKGQK